MGPDASDIRPMFRRVLRNAGKLLGGRTVNAVISLGYIALSARALGVQTFGALVLIHAFTQFLGDVVKFQSWQTVLQYGAAPLAQGQVKDLQGVVRFTLLLDLLSGLMGAAIGVAVALAFGERLGWSADLGPAAALYAISVLFMAPATATGLLRLFDRFDLMAAQVVTVSVVRLIGCGLGYLFGAPLWVFLVIWAVGSVAGFAMVGWAAWNELHKRGLTAGFSWAGGLKAPGPGVWRFAWATNLNSTLEVAFTHMVTLMVGALLGPANAALWRVGRQVADAIAKPAKLLTPALYPELARLRADKSEQAMWRLATHIGLAAGALGLVLLAIAIFAGEPLIRLIMGAGFENAAGVMTWQVAAAVIGLLTLPLESLVISLGYAGDTVRVRIAVAVCYAAVLPVLVTHFGIMGAGVSLVVAAATLALGMFWLLLHRRRRAGDELSV